MAHSCPECDQLCHCGGDIDDIEFGEADDCSCCLDKVEPNDDADADFYPDWGDA